MGISNKETGVLKLVRAGGIVELYRHPIKASEFMERYPRHCVTRPDFFMNPNVVVKPESILKPGKVFFIVPYHTVYRLVKANRNRHNMEDHDIQTLENTNSHTETTFFEDSENKEPSNGQNVPKDEDYDTDANEAGCFSTRKGATSCLKPCLKKNKPNKTQFQPGPKVRFMLPVPDHGDDEAKWVLNFQNSDLR